MRRLIRLVARLYPAAWRTRYAAEFEALLEALRPGSGDVWDVLRGAVIMQMTSWNFGKILAIGGLAGVMVASAVAYMKPSEYVSTAVMRIAPAKLTEGASPVEFRMRAQALLRQMQQEILSRKSLAEIILRPSLDLYRANRVRYPLEDIVLEMRNKWIRIRPVAPAGNLGAPAMAFEISYAYPNKFKAQAVVRELVTKFIEQNLLTPVGVVENLEVLDPASLPDRPESPNWPQMLMWGLIGGLLVGLATASVVARPSASTLKIVSSGIAGFLVVAALSLLIPSQYVSSAVLRAGPGAVSIDQLLDSELLGKVVAAQAKRNGRPLVQSVGELRERLTIRSVNAAVAGKVFVISFHSEDRFGAQWVVRQVVTEAFQKQGLAANGVEPSMVMPTSAPALQVLDPPSVPASAASPKRFAMASAGLLAGLLLGYWMFRSKRAAVAA